MEIEGEVADIIYQNEINSYTISTFETEDELVTIVGYLPFITSGDTLKLFGKFVEHKDYGRQFKVDTFVIGDDWEGKFDFLKDFL